MSSVPLPLDIIIAPNKLADVFGGDSTRIRMGRHCGAPAAIFNPVLAALQQRLDHLEKVEVSCQDVVEHAAKFLYCAVGFYEDAEERQ